MKAKSIRSLIIPALLVIASGTLAPAQQAGWKNDVRLRAGLWIPEDLPTEEGAVFGLEFRNLLWEHDGVVYGIHVYDEQRSETEPFGTGTIDLEADIRLVPILLGWFHLLPYEKVNFVFGAGGGLYESDAFSGGVTSTSQVSNFGEFRFLQDDTYFGIHIFFGADFFPRSRWSFGVEGRLHMVENDFNATELSVGGLYRF